MGLPGRFVNPRVGGFCLVISWPHQPCASYHARHFRQHVRGAVLQNFWPRADSETMASLSDSEILEQYKLARDALVAAINSGSMLVEYQVMSQRKRVTDPIKELEFVEAQIRAYEQRADQAAHGRVRNYAEIHRR